MLDIFNKKTVISVNDWIESYKQKTNYITENKFCTTCLTWKKRDKTEWTTNNNSSDNWHNCCKVCKNITRKPTELKYRLNKKSDPLYVISRNARSVVYNVLTKKGYTKNKKTFDIIGITPKLLKVYIESQFEDWMNWDNYGNPRDSIYEINKTWDIDHIIPISSATNEKELIKLLHYTNLQPLCSYKNRFIKRNL
jgi:hypothetical protein